MSGQLELLAGDRRAGFRVRASRDQLALSFGDDSAAGGELCTSCADEELEQAIA